MALKLKITDSKGISAEYYRIISITQNYVDNGINVNLAGYVDATFREDEKVTNEDKVISNTPVFLPFTDEDFSRAAIYTRIKAEIPEFSEAIDI